MKSSTIIGLILLIISIAIITWGLFASKWKRVYGVAIDGACTESSVVTNCRSRGYGNRFGWRRSVFNRPGFGVKSSSCVHKKRFDCIFNKLRYIVNNMQYEIPQFRATFTKVPLKLESGWNVPLFYDSTNPFVIKGQKPVSIQVILGGLTFFVSMFLIAGSNSKRA